MTYLPIPRSLSAGESMYLTFFIVEYKKNVYISADNEMGYLNKT